MRVKQVENVLDLFELYARDRAPLTLTAMARALGLPKSSAFNLIETLVERGFLYETRQRGGYYPTRRLFDVGREIMDGDPVLQTIHGELERLAADTGETVLLSLRRNDAVVYVDVVECASPIRYFAKIGDRRPVYTTSSGKAILTTYAARERAALLETFAYVAHQETTLTTPAALSAELDASLRRGWCEDRAEYTPDVMGIGVPLVHGERRYGLAIAGPIYRMGPQREALAATLRAAARRIQCVLQGPEAERAPRRPPAAPAHAR